MAITLVGSADKNLIQKWDLNAKACQSARVQFEHQWHTNMAFFFGRQWIVTTRNPNGSGFEIRELPSQDKWRVRHTANRILRIIRTELTKLSKEEAQFYCMPASTEEEDRLAAMAGDAISEYILRTRYFNRKRLLTTFWTLLCGTAYLKNYYDENKLDVDGKPGRIDFETVTPFHLLVPNLAATEMEEQPYVIHARTLSPEEVFKYYNKEVEPDTESTDILADSKFLASIGIKSQKSQETKQCYVKECYIKANKDFPNGALIVYAGNTILYVHERQDPMEEFENQFGPVGESDQLSLFDEEPLPEIEAPKSIYEGGQDYNHEYPYRHGRFPFAKVDHIPTGMWYCESVIKSLISPQKEYNRTRSIMLENRNLAAKPQWGYVKGAFDPRHLNSRPGLLLGINMGFEPPKPLEQPPLPPSIPQELEINLKDMDDISSQYEITKGRTPPGVEAASAIAYLSEENDTILYHTVQSLENAVQETGIQVLANAKDYWPEDRIVRMTSKNQWLEVKAFKAADLNPIMDFRVEPGSMAPKSLAARQAQIQELAKLGAITPKQMLRYLHMAETDSLYDEVVLDERHAQRENVYMANGQKLTKPDVDAQSQIDPMTGMPTMETPVKTAIQKDPQTGQDLIDQRTGQPATYEITTNPYDAHDIHIQEHQKFQKSQEYELLPPEIQKIFQDHVDEHKMEIIKEQKAVQVDQQLNGGEEVAPPRELEGENNAGPARV